MGRRKKFDREEILEKAIPFFWQHGFADASMDNLEKITGVNKSGLYSEFKSKEDLFLSSLRHYIEKTGDRILTGTPMGFANIEKYLNTILQCPENSRGCFAVNSMRELAILPEEASALIRDSLHRKKKLLLKNIEAEKTNANAEVLGDIIATFFSGLCIEQNLRRASTSTIKEIKSFMSILKSL